MQMQLQSSALLAAKTNVKCLQNGDGYTSFHTSVGEILDSIDAGLISFIELGLSDVHELLDLAVECAFVSAKTGKISPSAAVRFAGFYRCEQSRIKARRLAGIAA